ncbi:UNVERIFIED_CONTAM: hypothetical protein FKN15_024474 [Acipenser sinensis]
MAERSDVTAEGGTRNKKTNTFLHNALSTLHYHNPARRSAAGTAECCRCSGSSVRGVELSAVTNKKASGLIHARSNKKASGLIHARSNKKASGLINTRSSKKASGLINSRSSKKASGLIHARSNRKASGLIHARSNKKASGLIHARSNKKASGLINTRSNKKASGLINTRSNKKASGLIHARSNKKASGLIHARSNKKASGLIHARSNKKASGLIHARSNKKASGLIHARSNKKASGLIHARSNKKASGLIHARSNKKASGLINTRSNKKASGLIHARSNKKASGLIHARSNKKASGLIHARSNKKASGLIHARSNKKASGLIHARSNKKASGLINTRSNKKASGLINTRSNKKASGLINTRSNKKASGLINTRSNKKASGLINTRSNKKASGLINTRSNKKASGLGATMPVLKSLPGKLRGSKHSRNLGTPSRAPGALILGTMNGGANPFEEEEGEGGNNPFADKEVGGNPFEEEEGGESPARPSPDPLKDEECSSSLRGTLDRIRGVSPLKTLGKLGKGLRSSVRGKGTPGEEKTPSRSSEKDKRKSSHRSSEEPTSILRISVFYEISGVSCSDYNLLTRRLSFLKIGLGGKSRRESQADKLSLEREGERVEEEREGEKEEEKKAKEPLSGETELQIWKKTFYIMSEIRLPGKRKESLSNGEPSPPEREGGEGDPKRRLSFLKIGLGGKSRRESQADKLSLEREGERVEEEREGEKEEEKKAKEPLSVLEILRLVMKRDLFVADTHILELERECEGGGGAEGGAEEVGGHGRDSGRKLKDVELLYEALLKELGEVVRESLLPDSPAPPPALPLLLQVIEQEEQADREWAEREAGAPEGLSRPRQLRRKWKEGVAESASSRLPCRGDAGALAGFLGALSERVVQDLCAVKRNALPCYPPEYEAFAVHLQSYHQAVGQRLREAAAAELHITELHTLLDWELTSGSQLSPLLPLDTLSKLERDYISFIKETVTGELSEDLEAEERRWGESLQIEEYQSSLANNVIAKLQIHLDRSSSITAELGARVAHCCLSGLADFLQREVLNHSAFKELTSGSQLSPLLPLDTLSKLERDYISFIKEMVTEELSEDLDAEERRWGESLQIEEYQSSLANNVITCESQDCEEGLSRGMAVLDRIVSLGVKVLVEQLFQQIKPYFEKLVKRKWLNNTEAFDSVTEMIKSNFKTFCRMEGPPYQDSGSSWLDSAVPHLSEIIVLEDTPSIQMEVGVLVSQYPDVRKKHVAALLDMRGMLRQVERTEILNIVKDLESSLQPLPRDRALFSEIPVTSEVRCLNLGLSRVAITTSSLLTLLRERAGRGRGERRSSSERAERGERGERREERRGLNRVAITTSSLLTLLRERAGRGRGERRSSSERAERGESTHTHRERERNQHRNIAYSARFLNSNRRPNRLKTSEQFKLIIPHRRTIRSILIVGMLHLLIRFRLSHSSFPAPHTASPLLHRHANP